MMRERLRSLGVIYLILLFIQVLVGEIENGVSSAIHCCYARLLKNLILQLFLLDPIQDVEKNENIINLGACNE